MLDCCNMKTSKLKPYESDKDAYLAGFFGLKNSKRQKIKGRQSKLKVQNKKMIKLPYLKKPYNLKHSVTTKSLPPIDSRNNEIKPISKEEFKSLISKFRSEAIL